MEQMTVQEFAQKIVHEKEFRREAVDLCYNFEPPKDSEDGLALMLNDAAQKMGLEFDVDELKIALDEQIKTLGFFKKFTFVGSMINMARKAKEAEVKAADEAVEELIAEETAEAEEAAEDAAAEIEEAVEEAAEEATEAAEEVAEELAEAAEEAEEAAEEVAEEVEEAVDEAVEEVAEPAEEAVEAVEE